MPRTVFWSLRAALALSLLAFVVPVLLGQQPGAGKRYALVVGINEYEHGDLTPLKVAENDAKVLAKELEARGYTVVLLLGKEATRAAIEKSLRQVCEKCRKGDLVLVALSGHGMQFEATDVACFCPVDGRPVKERAETLVSMATVYRELKASFATDKLLLIDACRNDPNVRGRSGIEAQSAPVPFGVAALYACAPGQKANEDEKLGHGLFMHSVLAGLRGAARDAETGDVTFAHLAAYVQKQTPICARRTMGASPQTPTLEARYAVPPVLAVRDLERLKSPFGSKEIAAARRAWAKYLGVPESPTLDLGGGVKMQFVLIPPGEYDQGSSEGDKEAFRDEKPRRRVTITKAFYLQTTETTQAQYAKLTGKPNPSKNQVHGEYKEAVLGLDTSNFPVENINHSDSLDACRMATALARKAWLPARWSGDLPREGEWEYACRSGSTTNYHFGEDEKDLGKYAWYVDSRTGSRPDTVGARLPNGFGLYDMHGNVWEWCADGWDDKAYSPEQTTVDPFVGMRDHRTLRGGCYFTNSWYLRSANRGWNDPTRSGSGIGFRVCFRPD